MRHGSLLGKLIHLFSSLPEIASGVISGGLFINDKSLDASDYYNLMTFGPETQKGSRS
jgi:hypothetical protein